MILAQIFHIIISIPILIFAIEISSSYQTMICCLTNVGPICLEPFFDHFWSNRSSFPGPKSPRVLFPQEALSQDEDPQADLSRELENRCFGFDPITELFQSIEGFPKKKHTLDPIERDDLGWFRMRISLFKILIFCACVKELEGKTGYHLDVMGYIRVC